MYGQRWGDVSVHTIGASLFGGKDGVDFFREIGYEHYPFTHSPQGDMWERGRCPCDQGRNFGMWRDTVVARSDEPVDISMLRLPFTTEGGPACRGGSRLSTNIKNSESVTNVEGVRGPSCVGSDTFFLKIYSPVLDVDLLSSLFPPSKHLFCATQIRTFPSYLVS